MAAQFPMEFTLASGTNVVVQKQQSAYQFSLTPTEGAASNFTYREGERTKAGWDEVLTFEQLDALREFWTQTETGI